MATKSIIVTVLIAALANFLFSRGHVLNSFLANKPDRIARVNTFQNFDIKFADRLRNCEDAVLLKDRKLAIAACDAGRDKWNTVMGIYIPTTDLAYGELVAYNYAASGPGAGELTPIKVVGFPNATDFHTLGLEYDEPTSTLFVTNHAQAGPRVEIFKLDLDKFVATYIKTLVHPLLRIPNSIQLLGSHELYVSNDHHFTSRLHPILAKFETFLALPLSTVVHLVLDTTDYSIKTARVVARQPFANGVALFDGGKTLAVASSSGGAVHLYAVGKDRSLTLQKKIFVPFLPDNLELKDDKTLLITGHPHAPTLTAFAESRHVCNEKEALAAASEDKKRFCEEFGGLSWVAQWSEEEGLRSLFVESIYGSSATALFDTDAGFGLIAGLYAKGLFTWRE